MNETMANTVPIEWDGWYIHGDPDGIFRLCRSMDDMWVTLRKEFDSIEEATEYADKIIRGEIRVSDPNERGKDDCRLLKQSSSEAVA